MTKTSTPRISLLELQLLRVLPTDIAIPGRDVAREYKLRFGRVLSFGTLYTTLTRMETNKKIVESIPNAPGEDQRVRCYARTALGTKTFRRECP